MPNKSTVRAPSNIAFIKYWGARDLERVMPANPSISMTLDACYTRSTVEHLAEEGADEVRWRGRDGELEEAPPAFAERALRHLGYLRRWSGCGGRFRLATENSFPAAAGIASSASGFAALTLAVLEALGLDTSPAERSALARRSGSGSAARSVLGGFVEWPRGESEEECHAHQLAPASHWDLRDTVALVESGPKTISSLDGHRRAVTSPYFEPRLAHLPARLDDVRKALAARDFERLGRAIEAEAIDLHTVAMTSNPPIFYWKPGTLEVLEAVREMRRAGVAAYSTMDAGANVHVLCEGPSQDEVASRLEALGAVLKTVRDRVGEGPVRVDEHLF